jgi:ComF family protein
MARSAGIYDQALKALILNYKYRYRTELSAPLSRLLWHALLRHWDLKEIDCIMPVPLHRRRLRKRGFNQAELLLRHWPRLARAQGVAFDGAKLVLGGLARRRDTPPQAGLNQRQRAANLRHAFDLTDRGAVRGRRVLLVDDVMTTGATVNACARVLRRCHAAWIGVLTLAHAV